MKFNFKKFKSDARRMCNYLVNSRHLPPLQLKLVQISQSRNVEQDETATDWGNVRKRIIKTREGDG